MATASIRAIAGAASGRSVGFGACLTVAPCSCKGRRSWRPPITTGKGESRCEWHLEDGTAESACFVGATQPNAPAAEAVAV
jgi:hypothetical protein